MAISDIWQVYSHLDPPLWVVTAEAKGRRGGLIATTAVQASIASEMPRQLITIAKRHHTHALIESSSQFVLHLIDETQLDLVWRFGLQSGRDIDKFVGLSTRPGSCGGLLIANALAWFECRVEACLDIGDRSVYLAEVLDGCLQRTDPPLTQKRLLELASPEQRTIMREQYDADARQDAEVIRQWRAERCD